MLVTGSPTLDLPTSRPHRALSHALLVGVPVAMIVLVLGLSGLGQALLNDALPAPTPAALPSEFTGASPIPVYAGLAWPSDPTVLGALPPTALVTGELTFASLDPTGQEAVMNAIYTPGSPQYHHFLQDGQFNALFAPSAALQASYASYLSGYGVQATQTSPFLWNVQGTAAQMGAAFGTSFLSASYQGTQGYLPSGSLQIPSRFSSLGVSNDGGFETVLAQFTPTNYEAAMPIAPMPALSSQNTPLTHAGTLTINLTNQYIIAYQKAGAVAIPPTNWNETWNLSLSGGTAPYTVNWHWGDGTIQNVVTSASSIQLTHDFYTPGEIDSCYNEYCGNISIFVTDAASDNTSARAYLITALSPFAAETFYNLKPLYALDDSGAGTNIGFGELCDPDFTSADYTTDLDIFSSTYGLPVPKVTLIGTGDTSCTTGSAGWSGETTLDMEWAHTIAPNATLIVDLATTNPDEGDCTWDTLSNAVYVASNSWTGSYTSSCWSTAESQGQTFLSSTGDSGGPGFPGTTTDYMPLLATDVGVGGTFVYPMSSGIFHAEYAWNGTTITESSGTKADVGSTGGCSTTVTTPGFQSGMTGFSCSGRGAPDVAAMGGTWVTIYQICTSKLSSAGDCGSTTGPFWSAATGTSLACPSWAAFLDLAYTYNGTGTKANGFADWQLYAIAKSSTATYDTAFHDITMGSNKIGGTGVNAGVGWDGVTGLGSFNGAVLAEMIASADGNSAGISALTATLSANVTLGPAALSVGFGVDATGGGAALTGYSYAWTFGDGTTGTTAVPYTTHAYTTPGAYTASVVVSLGSNTGTTNGVTIHVSGTGGGAPLAVSATATPTSGTAPLAVTFGSTPSGGSGGNTFAWHLGLVGATSTSQNPSYTYTAAGTYSAWVNVTDSSGTTAQSNTLTITVSSTGSTLTATASSNVTTGKAPLAVAFTGTATGGTGGNTFSWYFGLAGVTSGLPSPTYTYPAAGTYNVWVNVTDSGGTTAKSNVLVITATSSGSTLSASASASTTTGAAPLTVDFTGASSGGSGGNSWAWHFGLIGATSTTQDPSYIYTTAGTYSAWVNVTDSAGTTAKSNVLTLTATSSGSALSITAAASPTSGTAPLSVSFSSTPAGGNDVYSTFAWHFGDGTTGDTQNPSHTYSAAGTYYAWANVTDSAGTTAMSNVLTVAASTSGSTLTVTASASATSGNGPLTITFTASVTGGQAPYTYLWTFGDGETSTSQDPTHTYSSTGTYTATVQATDSVGDVGTSQGIAITVASPLTGSLTADPTSVAVGGTTTLTVSVTGGTGTYSYSWLNLPPGCGGENSDQLSCSPTSVGSGTYDIAVTVTSGSATPLTLQTNLTVTAAPSSGSSPTLFGLSSLDAGVLILLGAVALVGIVAAVMVSRRRRHPPEAPPMAPPGGYGGQPPYGGYYGQPPS